MLLQNTDDAKTQHTHAPRAHVLHVEPGLANCSLWFSFCICSQTVHPDSRTRFQQARRPAATIWPRPSPPSGGAEAPRLAPPSPPRLQSADRNIAVGSHTQYVPTLTAAAAWRVNTAVSKSAWWPWPLTYWPWKWCPSHLWCGLPLCQF